MCKVVAIETQIIYQCNLNFNTVMPYLDLLLRNRLVVKTDGTVTKYKTTPKGAEALRCFRELEEMIPELRAMSEEEGVLL